MKQKNGFATAMACLAVGTLAGYLTGILTAKKPGKELRQDIKDEAEKMTRRTKETCSKLYSNAEDKVLTWKNMAMKKYEELRSANKGKKFNLANQINQIFHRTKSEV